jgi:S1-C subfamily serine protease
MPTIDKQITRMRGRPHGPAVFRIGDMIKFSLRMLVLFSAITIVCVFAACGKDGHKGLLGIVVPVGQEHVGKDTPYVITGVYEDSPAHSAGLRPDDRIVRVNGREIEGLEYDYIYNSLLLGPAGTRVTLHIDRKGETLVVDVVRGSGR